MKVNLLLNLIATHIRVKSNVAYEVLFVESFPNDLKQVGECRYEPKQIVIKNNESPTETFKTYIHEVLHALSNEYDINLTEAQVGKLENAIYKLLKLNKYLDKLVKII